MALLLYSVREFWKRCQTSLRGMLCLLKITKTFQAFLTVLCNKANLLAVHYSWDSKNLLIVSCWLSNRQQAVPVPQWAQPSPVLLNYNSMLSTQRISWSHQPLENILIETTSIIKYGSTICQAIGGKNALKVVYVCLSIQQCSAHEAALARWQKAGVHLQKTQVEWKKNFLGVSKRTIN